MLRHDSRRRTGKAGEQHEGLEPRPSSAVKRLPRYDDPGFHRFLRCCQRGNLLPGNRAAARKRTNERVGRWEAAYGGASAGAADPAVATRAGRR